MPFDLDCEECREEREEKTMTTERVGLLQRAEVCGWPYTHFAGSQHMAGEEQWRRGVTTLMPAEVE